MVLGILLFLACSGGAIDSACDEAPVPADCRYHSELRCDPCTQYASFCSPSDDSGTYRLLTTDHPCECITSTGGLSSRAECQHEDM